MKTLKNILATIAFVSAFVAAFATMGSNKSKNLSLTEVTAFRVSDCSTVTCSTVGAGTSCDDHYTTNSPSCQGNLVDGYNELN